MLIKDYIRLGRISIKSRKKSTRNTVLGIAFGLIVLVPVIYFTMAFYIGLLGAVNATRGVACFSFATVGRESEEGAAVDESDHILLGRTEYNRMYAEIGNTVEEVIYNEYYELSVRNVNDGAYAVLDGAEENVFYAPSGGGSEKGVVYLNALVKIVESGRTGKNVIPAGLNADLESEGKRFLRAGEGFSQDARGQVLIGETLAAAMGFAPEEAVGKPFSVFAYGGGEPEDAVEVVAGFTVAGVISEEYFLLGDKNKTEQDAQVWLSGDSVYEETDGGLVTKYLPDVTRRYEYTSSGTEQVVHETHYPRDMRQMEAEAKAEKFFFPAMTVMDFFGYNTPDDVLKPVATLTVQCKDYAAATAVAAILNRGYDRLTKQQNALLEDHSDRFAGSLYVNLSILHRTGKYVMTVLYTFGGIVLLATLLNLYNSVNYSVQVRRNYIGMMRAIGARKSLLPKLYFVEILLIFARSAPWVLAFGGAISYGIKALIDYAFSVANALFSGIVIGIKFGYFFLALAVVLALAFFVAWLFSRVACLPVTRKPVLEVLSDEK